MFGGSERFPRGFDLFPRVSVSDWVCFELCESVFFCAGGSRGEGREEVGDTMRRRERVGSSVELGHYCENDTSDKKIQKLTLESETG